MALVDSASAVAERVARDLAALGLAAPAGAVGSEGTLHAYVTDTAEQFRRLAERILPGAATFELVDVT